MSDGTRFAAQGGGGTRRRRRACVWAAGDASNAACARAVSALAAQFCAEFVQSWPYIGTHRARTPLQAGQKGSGLGGRTEAPRTRRLRAAGGEFLAAQGAIASDMGLNLIGG